MDKLLLCPFCGGEAETKMYLWGEHAETHAPIWCYYAFCRACDAMTDNVFKTEEEAISAWNRRAQPENEPLTLDELKQMDGEPIWIKEFPPYAFAGYKVLSLRVVDVYGDIVCEDGDIYEYERYGETWLAYRSKPKEEV